MQAKPDRNNLLSTRKQRNPRISNLCGYPRLSRLHDLVIHGGIATVGGSWSSSAVGVLVRLVGRDEVVSHLGIEFFRGLLGGTSASGLLLAATTTTGTRGGSLASSLLLLVVGGRLGLGLRLGDTLGKRLRGRGYFSSLRAADDDLDL